MNLPSTPAQCWTERYQALRQHFLHNRPLLAAEPLALTLLLQQGLAGWIRAWPSGASTASTPTQLPPSACPRPPVPVGPQELTRLLAHMTTTHLYPTPKEP